MASMAKGCASSSTVTLLVAEEDTPSFGVAQKRHKHILTPVQLFSKWYYNSLVKPVVEAKLAALSQEQTLSRGERLLLRIAKRDIVWANVSKSIKAEIEKLHCSQKDMIFNDNDNNDNEDNDEDRDNKKVADESMPKDQYLRGKDLEK